MKRLLFAALLLPTAATAQTVYKCTTNGQTAYQQQPCADDAKSTELRFRDNNADPLSNDAYLRMSRNVKLNDINRTGDECVAEANRRIWYQANRRIARLDQQINRLRLNIQRANNNAAGASWEAGMRSEIAGLEQAIATERTSADALVMEAEQRCNDQRDNAINTATEQFASEDEQRAAQSAAEPTE